MTAPSTAKNTPAKSAAPATPVVKKEDVTPTSEVKETETKRIPSALADNPILQDFCNRYLEVFDEITKYNKDVLADKDAEWNSSKVLDKARELGRPTDKNVKANEDIKKALEVWEDFVNKVAQARKTVIDETAKVLGITLSATSVRDPEVEAPLKEKRKVAILIGSQLSQIAEMTNDQNSSTAVTEFLSKNPMPAIGRDQVRSFGSESGKSTPKYRVHVEVTKDGETLLSEDGFTKTALALTKSTFGYERGQALKSEDLRKAWEKAGNTPENTVQPSVEFTDNGLNFVITKK